MGVSFILTCAGNGSRAGFNQNKLLVEIDGKNSIERCLETVANCKQITQIIVTSSKADFNAIKKIALPYGALVIEGGSTRTQSIKNALEFCNQEIVLIHDGARPFVSTLLIQRCIEGAQKYGGVIPVVESANTIVKADDRKATLYLGKKGLFNVQTPQAFNLEQIISAYKMADGKTFNDDGEIYKEYIGELHLVEGESKNIKLTYQEDFNRENLDKYRFGCGFDCHKLVEGRKLILGGVEIAHTKGLLGHSDADVLTHAIMDAMLSALALRDIGYHFPDSDQKFKGANSIELLKQVMSIIYHKGYEVKSVSAVIMAERPKLLNIIPQITQNLATVLNLSCDKVGIGATTLEGLGFVGREEGICVHATATLTLKD